MCSPRACEDIVNAPFLCSYCFKRTCCSLVAVCSQKGGRARRNAGDLYEMKSTRPPCQIVGVLSLGVSTDCAQRTSVIRPSIETRIFLHYSHLCSLHKSFGWEKDAYRSVKTKNYHQFKSILKRFALASYKCMVYGRYDNVPGTLVAS